MDLNDQLGAVGYSRGGWHTSADPRLHLTSVPPGQSQAVHQYLEPGDTARMLGRAAIGLTLGGPNQ